MHKRFKRFFSTDSHKAAKAQSFGWLNGINYMAPHTLASRGNMCSHASPACMALCLGWFSGQAGMAKGMKLNSVRKSRIAKVRAFMGDRQSFMAEMAWHIASLMRQAVRLKLRLAIRPNGSTDIAFESIRFTVDTDLASELTRIAGRTFVADEFTIMTLYPEVQFVDYTKNPRRFDRALPANYSLTFSRSETNESACLDVLARGHNVAVIFDGDKPATWHGYRVVDGDKHDLRHLDPRNVVIGLSPKGHKARRDSSGFVVRQAA